MRSFCGNALASVPNSSAQPAMMPQSMPWLTSGQQAHSLHHMACPRLTLTPPPTRLPHLPTRRTGFDSRVRGSGRLDWRLWGWLPAHSANGPALDRTLLVRWLAGELMTVSAWGGMWPRLQTLLGLTSRAGSVPGGHRKRHYIHIHPRLCL